MSIKVLMFGWEFPPHNSGGLGVACLGLSQAMAKEGIEVVFVLPKKLDVLAKNIRLVFADQVSKIKFHIINSLLSPYLTTEKYCWHKFFCNSDIYGSNLFEEVKRYGIRAREVAEQETFDIIHAHDWLSFLAGLEAKRVSGKPLVVHVHATEFDRTGGQGVNQFVYEIEKEGLQNADAIIAVSNFTKQILVDHYQINPEKITVVHNGIEENKASDFIASSQKLSAFKAAGYKIILFVGRLTLQKGPDYFLTMAKKVLQYHPKTLFVISGSGDMERQMIQMAAQLGIGDKVLFTGFLRDEELKQIYASADLFVMPSVSEPFGLAALEALTAGTPVLLSKQSGVSEVITNALKVDFWDTDEMVNQILAVINHQALQNCLQENGQAEVKKVSWKNAVDKCLNVYKRLM